MMFSNTIYYILIIRLLFLKMLFIIITCLINFLNELNVFAYSVAHAVYSVLIIIIFIVQYLPL